MQQESSQSDLAERDVPTRSRARFPGGAAEGAGAERVCLSVRPSVCLSVWDTKTLLSLTGHGIRGYGSIAVLVLFSPLRDVTPSDAPVPIEEGEEEEEGASLSFFDYQADSRLERLNTEGEEEEEVPENRSEGKLKQGARRTEGGRERGE